MVRGAAYSHTLTNRHTTPQSLGVAGYSGGAGAVCNQSLAVFKQTAGCQGSLEWEWWGGGVWHLVQVFLDLMHKTAHV